MPKSSWIQDAELIPENKPYKVDASNRIIVPSHLRAKFNIAPGNCLSYYTTFVDGKWFLCACLYTDEYGNKLDMDGNIIEYAPGYNPNESSNGD